MHELFSDKGHVYRLHEYVILESHDGTYEFITWDFEGEQPLWMRGQAEILGDVLGLADFTSHGEEKTVKNRFVLTRELHRLPEWNKTTFYCALMSDRKASLIHYCRTDVPLRERGKDYPMVKDMLKQHGVEVVEESR